MSLNHTCRRSVSAITTLLVLFLAGAIAAAPPPRGDGGDQPVVSTFSIVAHDSTTGELGVAVASKFFAVGAVVPWGAADVGAVATQAYANTTFGWRGLDLMDQGLTPEEALEVLLRNDERPSRRQIGMVSAEGASVTFTGDSCSAWAGGRTGPGYAVQGNILAGEEVVVEMEQAYLQTEGTLAERLYAALVAGEGAGGDSRGKQSAAILVVKEGAGYGGYTDRAIDIRVDDHLEPFKELGRLLTIAQTWYAWNEAWTAYTEERYEEALPPMERAAEWDPDNGGVFYDLAIIRGANGMIDEGLDALETALQLNPDLKSQAKTDSDLDSLRGEARFEALLK